MRHIAKSVLPPQSIREWLEIQIPVGLNLNYPNFNRKPALRQELIAEQFGLCAYTGAPIDERLGGFHNMNYVFQSHIEHVKPRAVCEEELVARGGIYGVDLCEDLDYRNLVAALEVKRKPPAKSEIFGAAARGQYILPVTPLQTDCENRFRYDGYGGIHGVDMPTNQTIGLLKLNHPTLVDWRRGAIAGFLPDELTFSKEELTQIIEQLGQPNQGKLPEFSFCIRDYARSLL